MRSWRTSLWALAILVALAASPEAFGAAPAYVHPRVHQDLAEKGTAGVIVSLWDDALPQARAKQWPDRIPAVQELARRAIAAAPKFQVYRQYQIFPFLAGSVDENGLAELAACPIVEGIYPDFEVKATLNQSGPLIGQPQAETAGFTGTGIGIAIVDTGIDYTHPDFGAPAPYPNTKVRGGYDFANNDTNPFDDEGHGTHVASIAAGMGTTYRGIAPGAHLLAVKVMDASGTGMMSTVMAGVEWCILHKTEFNIRVINMSLGISAEFTDPADCDDFPEAQAIEEAVSAGILVAISSGNDGYLYGISFPACISAATSVGATYDETRSGGTVDTTTYYSNRGELVDLLAPGSFIMAAKLGGGYIEHEGTSMAAPHVAGAAAVLAQKGLGTPAAIEQRLKLTGTQIVDPSTNLQTPRIDLEQALQGAPTTGPDLVVTAVSISSATVQYGDQVTVSVTINNQGTSSAEFLEAIVALSTNSIPSPQDTILTTFNIPLLNAGQQSVRSRTITFPEMPGGTYQLVGFADSSYTVAEKDETNNGLTGTTVRVGYTAMVVDNSIPEFMLPGGTYPVSVTMENDGDSPWTAADGFVLAPTSPHNTTRWGVSSAALPDGASVSSGEQVTFEFNVTAPTEIGWYPCHWQMRRGATGFFGEVATGGTRVLVADDHIYGQNYPAVSGDRIAYEDYGRMSTEYAITVKDLNAGGTFTIPDDVRLPYDPQTGWPVPPYEYFDIAWHWLPQISGPWLTWMVDDVEGYVGIYDSYFLFYQIAAFNLESPYDYPTRVTYQASDAIFPAVDGGRIVWEDYTNDPDGLAFFPWSPYEENPDIGIWDPDTGGSYLLCSEPDWQMSPRISGNLVVWEDWRDGQGDIYLYDLSVDSDADGTPNWKDPDRPYPDPAEIRLTTTDWDEITPDISGRTVVFGDMERDTGLGDIVDIYALNIDTMVKTAVVTDPPCFREQPRIDGGQVVWTDYRLGVPDVYWTDLALGDPMPQPLGGSAAWEVVPDIDGRRLAYGKYREDYGVWNVVLQRLFTHGSVGVHTFVDVTSDYWAWAYVEAVADHGVAGGYGAGIYGPENVVTRDQMAVYLARAIAGGDGSVPAGPVTPTFSDVGTGHWAYKYIEYCADPAQDIVGGVDGAYLPDLAVNRGAMAVFVGRGMAGGDSFFDTYTPPATPTFADVTSTNAWDWCYKYVEYIKSQGVVGGYEDGLYHPEIECTRGQMAVYVSRAFGYLP